MSLAATPFPGAWGSEPQALESYEPLLTELASALLGFWGDVFVYHEPEESLDSPLVLEPEPSTCPVQLSPDITWVHNAMRHNVNAVVRLGYHYFAIHTFCQQEQHSVYGGGSSGGGVYTPSAYRRALANGLQELLEVYRISVHQLLVLRPRPVMARVKQQLGEFEGLLPALHKLVHDVQVSSALAGGSARFSGMALMNRLHRACALGGDSVLASTMQRLLWHCNQVLFRQLTAWMVHGMLLDPHGEFFIQANTPSRTNPASASSAGPTSTHAASHAMAGCRQGTPATGPAAGSAAGGSNSGVNTAAAAGMADGISAGSRSSGGGGAGGEAMSEEEASYWDWTSGFAVRPERLPLYLSPDIAEKVLFVGRAVRVLKDPKGALKGHTLLPLQDTMEAAAALSALAAERHVRRGALEATVLAIRTKVAGLLWHLLVERAGLSSHLAALKDYFLMAAGDMWREFLDAAAGAMAQPVRSTAAANAQLASALSAAALRSNAEYDRLFSCLRLSYCPPEEQERLMPLSKNGGQHALPEFDAGWDPLLLDYSLEWPLGLLLTPEVMRRYNQLFNMLLRLKRAHVALDELWTGVLKRAASSPGVARAIELRRHMAHVIANVRLYIQLDVVEVNFASLETAVADARDYQALSDAHWRYQHTLFEQCFMPLKPVCEILSGILKSTRSLCRLVQSAAEDAAAGSSGPGSGGPSAAAVGGSASRLGSLVLHGLEGAELCNVQGEYEKRVAELAKQIKSVRLQALQRAPHLAQLHLRLDYNGKLINDRSVLY